MKIVIGIGWLLAAVLLIDFLRRPYPRWLKAALVVVLLTPILGPFFYLWIRSFPASNRDDLMDHQRYELDLLNRWRARLEASGILSPRWSARDGRAPKAGQSIWEEGQESAADAAARVARREAKRLRRARLYRRANPKK